MYKNILIGALVVVVVLLGGYAVSKNKIEKTLSTTNETKQDVLFGTQNSEKSFCPFVLGEGAGFRVLMDECNPVKDSNDGSILKDLYHTPTTTVVATDGSVKKTYNLPRDFGPGGALGGLQVDQSKSYLFMDEGTWIVRSLTIFSLKDGRFKQIQYMNTPILTKNGYLVYNVPSRVYADVHQEVDQSAAEDVLAIKLSDFSIRYLFQGDVKTDYSVIADKIDNEKIIDEFSDDSLTVNKAIFNDPAHYDAGLIRTKIHFPITELTKTSEYLNIPELKIKFEKIPGLDLDYSISNGAVTFHSVAIRAKAIEDLGLSQCINDAFSLLEISKISRAQTEYQGYNQFLLSDGRFLNMYGQQAVCYATSNQANAKLVNDQQALFVQFLNTVESY